MNRWARPTLTATGLLLLVACSAGPAAPAGPVPSPSAAPVTPVISVTPTGPTGPATSGSGADDPDPEPTTTNTLPPPPEPTGPAPSTAGVLTADTLPVPSGWTTVALEGGSEEGFRGNGTWVHARDPRYAASAAITVGCDQVTRDDYPDPVAALEGNYVDDDGAPGVALALDFADEAAATAYWQEYNAQVDACRDAEEPVRTERVEGLPGLVDRRTYADGEWTEIGRRTGARVVLVILTDEGHEMTRTQARELLEQLA